MFRTAVILVASAALLACTSLRPLDATTAADIKTGLKKGASVSVLTTTGQTYELKLTYVGDDALYGLDSNWMNHKIEYADIAQIEVRRFSLWKTIATMTGITALVLVHPDPGVD